MVSSELGELGLNGKGGWVEKGCGWLAPPPRGGRGVCSFSDALDPSAAVVHVVGLRLVAVLLDVHVFE